MESKKCGKCLKLLPKTKDYFFLKKTTQKNKSGIATYYSFRSICKKCHAIEVRERKAKKRCEELNCSEAEYRSKWKEQYTNTRSKDPIAIKVLTTGQYQHYLKTGETDVYSYLKRVEESKLIRDAKLSEMSKSTRTIFTKDDKRLAWKRYQKRNSSVLSDSYIANQIMRKKVRDLNPEIIETKRLIVKLKRHLKDGN